MCFSYWAPGLIAGNSCRTEGVWVKNMCRNVSGLFEISVESQISFSNLLTSPECSCYRSFFPLEFSYSCYLSTNSLAVTWTYISSILDFTCVLFSLGIKLMFTFCLSLWIIRAIFLQAWKPSTEIEYSVQFEKKKAEHFKCATHILTYWTEYEMCNMWKYLGLWSSI